MDEKEKQNGESEPSGPLDIKGEKTIGEILLEGRERSGMSLEKISLDTRIPKKSIEYLETDNFDALPAKVYVRGFLRSYARVLGLDVQQLLNRFELQTGQTHKSRGDRWETEENIIEEELVSPHIFKRFVLPALAVVVVIILIVWGLSRLGGEDVQLPEDLPAAGEQTGVENGTTVEDAGPGGGGGSDVRKETGSYEEQEAGDQARPVGTVNAARDELETSGEKSDGEMHAGSVEPMELRIIANERDTTWFDMVLYTTRDSRPDTSFRDFILFPGQIETLKATEAFFFRTIGNAGGFSLELSGSLLPPLGERGVVRRNIRVTRDGLASE